MVYEEYERGQDRQVMLQGKGICVQFCLVCCLFFFPLDLRFKIDLSLHFIAIRNIYTYIYIMIYVFMSLSDIYLFLFMSVSHTCPH